jgi:uncharacterized protein (TIGR02147 family)
MKADQDIISEMLASKLSDLKKKNPRISLRSMAKKASISPSTLSEIINKKRDITKDLATKIADALFAEGVERKRFLEPFRLNEQIKDQVIYDEYDHNLFAPEDNWIVFAILNLIEIERFILSADSTALSLGIDPEKAKEVIEKMFAQKLIFWDQDGKVRRTNNRVQTQDGSSDIGLRLMHEKNLELAKRSLTNDSVELRDFTSMTFAINKKQIVKARGIIRKFEDELSQFLAFGETDEVYKINVQLFPLSHNDREVS